MFFHHYFAVHTLDLATSSGAVLASAAMPFGRVNSVDIGNTTYVDGGSWTIVRSSL
jgi:predicted patatin/cPLA2 family phospholipase